MSAKLGRSSARAAFAAAPSGLPFYDSYLLPLLLYSLKFHFKFIKGAYRYIYTNLYRYVPPVGAPGLRARLGLCRTPSRALKPSKPSQGPGWARALRAGYPGLQGLKPGPAHHYLNHPFHSDPKPVPQSPCPAYIAPTREDISGDTPVLHWRHASIFPG